MDLRMIIELNAFGCKQLVAVPDDQPQFRIAWIPKSQTLSAQARTEPEPYESLIPRTAVFEWFGDLNENNIRVFYLSNIE
jgi:hypothetical protein